MKLLKFIKSEKKVNILPDLLEEVKKIRDKSTFVVLVPGTTGYSWMGVNRSTIVTFPDSCIELPQNYSSCNLSNNELDILINTIYKLQFEQVILSGFPPYFDFIVRQLYNKGIKVKVLYHGFFSELAENLPQNVILKTIIDLSAHGMIHAVGFNKKGMAETMKSLWGMNAFKYNFFSPIRVKKSNKTDLIKIGILGNDQFRKNLHNQITAASLIENAEIHVTTEQDFSYLPDHVQLVRHKTGKEHQEFLDILGGVDINLHLSYSESWGMLTTESLSMGIPCIVSYHSDIFDYDEDLFSLLVVKDYDNNFAIKDRIKEVLNTDGLADRCMNYLNKLNEISKESLKAFLNN